MKKVHALLLVAIFAVVTAMVPTVYAAGKSCDKRVNNNHKKLLQCVTLEGVREHQAALQAIADANGGTRASGTPGYEASVEYVAETMAAAGYEVTLNAFPFVYIAPASLRQLTPITVTYDTGLFTGAGFGTVTANVSAVDLMLGPGNTSTSGCEAADFAGFPAGNIALIQRGTCSFALKALNAEAAGAAAVVIFNQGNDSLRTGIIIGTLGGTNIVSIPVVGTSYADGVALTQPGSTAFVNVDAPQAITVYNVLAETPGGNPHNVIMAGGHLDSVARGPGINDNGSGTAALLETAEQMAKVKPRNKVRFAFWGAEEDGLVGSTAYVNGLSAKEQEDIALYLNFDMIGSPNYVFFIYDGDDSDGVGSGPGPAGSDQIEKTFERYFNMVGEPFLGTDFTGRSDYGPFIAVGIPSGGLFTGAEGIKTAEQAAIWGGTAGQQYDPCYHLHCDTYANNNDHALEINSDAVAYATLKYAMSTSDINGLRRRSNFGPRAYATYHQETTE